MPGAAEVEQQQMPLLLAFAFSFSSQWNQCLRGGPALRPLSPRAHASRRRYPRPPRRRVPPPEAPPPGHSPPGGLAILASAPVRMMTDVVPFPFRQDVDYAFLTGCTQPGGLAVLCPRSGLSLFLPQPPRRETLWQGPAADLDAATRFFRADRAFPLSSLPQLLPPMLRQASRVFHNPKTSPASPYSRLEAFQQALADSRVHDISAYTHELR